MVNNIETLLTVDTGNTQHVLGLWEKGVLFSTCRLASRPDTTDWEWKAYLDGWLGLGKKIPTAIIASVVPAAVAPLRRCLQNFYHCQDILMVDHKMNLPFTFQYPGLETLGADRIANAAGGVRWYGENLIIVDFGTAVTYCLIRGGSYLGGLIAPGIDMSMKALFQKTSKLPAVAFAPPGGVLGKDTISSIQSGVWFTWKGAVKEIIERLKRLFDEGETIVVATGGITEELPFASDFFDIVDPHLTLRGLVEIYDKNTQRH